MEQSNGNQTESKPGRGGYRAGAGRKRIARSLMLSEAMRAKRVSPLHAAEILASVCDERETWRKILSDDDTRVVLDAMKFLVAMRDGRPAQQINVTSQTLTLSGADIIAAREIVRELRGETRALLPPASDCHSDNDAASDAGARDIDSELYPREPASIMVVEGQGGNLGGSGSKGEGT